MTKLAREILDMIKEEKTHLTAEEIFLHAKNKNINISMASTYRVLNNLVSDGYLKRVTFQDMPDIYDITTIDHEHLVCSRCGKIMDTHLPNLKDILKKDLDVDILGYDLSIKYLCKECKKKEEMK